MWQKILIGAVAIAAILLAIVAMQPAEFAVERSVSIDAPADVVYAHIQSLRAMDEWSPFGRMDPTMKIRYEGPESGVGARSSWESPQMGTGSLQIVAVQPDREVEMRLEMREPMAATNRILFTLDPGADATRVTWRMEGRNGLLGKAISLVVGMDGMVGGDFERGLESLRLAAEADVARRHSAAAS